MKLFLSGNSHLYVLTSVLSEVFDGVLIFLFFSLSLFFGCLFLIIKSPEMILICPSLFSPLLCVFLSFPFDPFETYHFFLIILLGFFNCVLKSQSPLFFCNIPLYNTIHILFELFSINFKYVNNILC